MSGRMLSKLVVSALFIVPAFSPYAAEVAFDESSDAAYAGGFLSGSDGGTGFNPWTITSSAGSGEGWTNFAGSFIGDSMLYGGGDVNSAETNAFGLYANQSAIPGTNGPAPECNALRPFFGALDIGQSFEAELGVRFRNGSKGMTLQQSGTWLFSFEVSEDDYVYRNWAVDNGTARSMGWAYADDSAVRVRVLQTASNIYDITLIRSGSGATTTRLDQVVLGAQPDQVRFFVYNTDQGGENNLYFNRPTIASTNLLEVSVVPNVEIDATNLLTLTRRQADTSTVTVVTIGNTDTSAVSVAEWVEIPEGEIAVTIPVVGLASGDAALTFTATGFVGAATTMRAEVFPSVFDNAGNYPPNGFVNGSDGGRGFGAWSFNALSGGATIMLRDTRVTGGDLNAVNERGFALLGGSDGSYAEATRALDAELVPGEALNVDLGMNWDGGARGLDIRDADGQTLFNFNMGSDTQFHSYAFQGGDQQALEGWGYSATSVTEVAVTQLDGHGIDVTLTRNDGLTTNVSAYSLSGPVGGLKVYNGGHNGHPNRLLAVNNLSVTYGPALVIDGPGVVDIGATQTFYVSRANATTTAVLTVALYSSNPGVLAVPASVNIPAGEWTASFDAVGAFDAVATLRAEATGLPTAYAMVDVFALDDESDQAGNYFRSDFVPGTFTNGANGGLGLQAWQIVTNQGEAVLLPSDAWAGDIDSFNALSFCFQGGSDGSYVEGVRPFGAALGEGDQALVRLSVNYSAGARGLDILDGAAGLLFNFNLSSDNYTYKFGTNDGVSLGWGYSATSIVTVVVEQRSENRLEVTLTRNDGSSTNILSESLAAAAERWKFYNGGHDAADRRQALFVNDLSITRASYHDGIPVSWWARYSLSLTNTATGDNDGDTTSNFEEYIADTDPTNALSVFDNRVMDAAPGADTVLWVGPPTTNTRRYAVWFTTNLMADPQEWTVLIPGVTGQSDGSALGLSVTNDDPARIYRTGVRLP